MPKDKAKEAGGSSIEATLIALGAAEDDAQGTAQGGAQGASGCEQERDRAGGVSAR